MSWPQWPVGGTSAIPAVINPAPTVANPIAQPILNPAAAAAAVPAQYTPEQWAQMQHQNWQQWAQWQQQYQQWHQQYGAEYQKAVSAQGVATIQPPLPALQNLAPVANTTLPPPPPSEPKPPLPPEEPTSCNKPPPPNTYERGGGGGGFSGGRNTNWQPMNENRNRRFSNQDQSFGKRTTNYQGGSDSKRSRSDDNWQKINETSSPLNQWQSSTSQNKSTPPKPIVNTEELSEAEKKFDKQFAEWEAQFTKWKEQNANHPDKTQYREYEKKWETWRAQLLERREQMRRKRLNLANASPKLAHMEKKQVAESPAANVSFTRPPPTVNNDPLEFARKPTPGGFDDHDEGKQSEKKEFDASFLTSASTGGIPGLDLVKEDETDEKPDVEVIDADAVNSPVLETKSQDLEALSKGINSILGDQKLLSMLSMVSKNQNLNFNNTQPVAEKTEQSNQSNDDNSNQTGNYNFKQPTENFNTFDDQTRSSFTTGANDQDMRFEAPPSDVPANFGRPPNFENFRQQSDPNDFRDGNKESRFRSTNEMQGPPDFGGAGDFNRVGPNSEVNRERPNEFIRGGPNEINRGTPNEFNQGGPNDFNRRGPNDFSRGKPNEFDQGGPNDFNRGKPNEFNQGGPNHFNRGGSNEFTQGGPNDFNRGGPNAFNRRGPNEFHHHRPNEFNRGGPNEFHQVPPNEFNRGGPNQFNQGGPNTFNRGGPNEFTQRGPNEFNRGGPNQFNQGGPNEFNRGGPNEFNRGGPTAFNRGQPNEFIQERPNEFNEGGTNEFNMGGPNQGRPNEFNRGGPNQGPPNEINQGRPNDFNRGGPNEFNRGGPNNFNRGPMNTFNRGGSNESGPNDFNRGGPNDFNRGPNFNDDRNMNKPDRWDRNGPFERNAPNRFSGGPPGNFNQGPHGAFVEEPNYMENKQDFQAGPPESGRLPPSNFNQGPHPNFNQGPQPNFNQAPQTNFNQGPQPNFNQGPQRGNENFGGRDNFNRERPENFNAQQPNEPWRGPPRNFVEGARRESRFSGPPEDKPALIQKPETSDQHSNQGCEELDILKPETVVEYDHKPLKSAEPEVIVEPIQTFDYRHKPVNRIPLPQRPQWLSETLRGVREFEPLLNTRSLEQTRRYNDWKYDDRKKYDGYYEERRSSRFDDYTESRSESRYSYEERRSYERSRSRDRDDFNEDSRHGYGGSKGYGRGEERRKYDDDRISKYDERSRSEKYDAQPMRSSEKYDAHSTRSEKYDAQSLRSSEKYEAPSMRSSEKYETPSMRSSEKYDTQLVRSDRYEVKNRPIVVEEPRTAPVNMTTVTASSKVTLIDDILSPPGRYSRPARIVIILRGPPGSGKTTLAKLIKDKEVENGGSAPRILSLDDYFMVEQEKEIIEDGRKVTIKEMKYEYEECMEASYRTSLIKSFKKTITDGYFNFIIVDNVNDKVKYFGEMWSFAKQNGFQVYICQLELDVQACTKRNVHGRTEAEVEKCVAGWEPTPSHHPVVDATSLIQAESIPEVEMEEINSPPSVEEVEVEEHSCRSKWDSFDCSNDNLAKLDGTSKPLKPSRTMEDYLQLDDEWEPKTESKPGQKRVRWADLEERKEQEKMRAIGFVVGQTNWDRMMDPTMGGSALTQTKYIERVGKY